MRFCSHFITGEKGQSCYFYVCICIAECTHQLSNNTHTLTYIYIYVYKCLCKYFYMYRTWFAYLNSRTIRLICDGLVVANNLLATTCYILRRLFVVARSVLCCSDMISTKAIKGFVKIHKLKHPKYKILIFGG